MTKICNKCGNYHKGSIYDTSAKCPDCGEKLKHWNEAENGISK